MSEVLPLTQEKMSTERVRNLIRERLSDVLHMGSDHEADEKLEALRVYTMIEDPLAEERALDSFMRTWRSDTSFVLDFIKNIEVQTDWTSYAELRPLIAAEVGDIKTARMVALHLEPRIPGSDRPVVDLE